MPASRKARFPTKQIHLIVPTSAGGVHDVIGRIWADRVKGALGNIVVENRAGGGSSIALNYVAQQPADGHTLLIGSTSTLVLREGSNNKAYDALKDIASISILATTSTSIAVHPSLPVKSLKELIAYLKANPGKLSYGSGGVGAITHITPELFKQQAGGLDMLHVPYRGIGPAMNDLLGGQIQVIFPNITAAVVALHRNGKLRLLSVNAPERLEAMPDLPTSHEEGLEGFRVADLLRRVHADQDADADPRADQRGDPEGMVRQGIPEEARRLRLRADARLRPRARRPLPARGIRQVESGGAEGAGTVTLRATCRLPMSGDSTHAPLGRPALRVEDATLLRGRGRFVDDIALPGLLHASFVRSPVAHARLNGIDASAARALPGVRAVLTYRDLRPLDRLSTAFRWRCRSPPSGIMSIRRGWRRRRCASPASRSPSWWPRAARIAEDAANLVVLDYEELPPVHRSGRGARTPARRRRGSIAPTISSPNGR